MQPRKTNDIGLKEKRFNKEKSYMYNFFFLH